MDRYVKVDDVMGLINTSNRGNCDYFIVDQIEELCVSKKTITEAEIRAKAIEEFAEKLKESMEKKYRHLIDVDRDGFEWLTTDAVETHIDETVKEMKGE